MPRSAASTRSRATRSRAVAEPFSNASAGRVDCVWDAVAGHPAGMAATTRSHHAAARARAAGKA